MSQEVVLKVSELGVLYDLLFSKVDIGGGNQKAVLHTNPSVAVRGVCVPFNSSSPSGLLTETPVDVSFGGYTSVNINLFNLSQPETEGFSPKIYISLDGGSTWNTVLPLQERSWDISRTNVWLKTEVGKTAECELSYLA